MRVFSRREAVLLAAGGLFAAAASKLPALALRELYFPEYRHIHKSGIAGAS